jgi:cytochrome c peroxidase
MHDGSMKSLDEIINHYKQGGQKHKLQSPVIQPFELSAKEQSQLIAFLYALTDTSYMRSMKFR